MSMKNRIAGFFIILAGIYYCWNAYVLPVRGDEAYLYLKSTGLSWTTIAHTGLIEFILKAMDFFGASALQLRLPSIIFISLSVLIIYYITLNISDNYGAFFSMVLFFVYPPVTYSYMSMTPNALFIFCFALYMYSFYMITVSSDNKSSKYYILLALSIICAVSVDFSGILLLLNHIIYYFVKKEAVDNKKYMLVTLVSIAFLILFIILHIIGIFDLFYKYPLKQDDNMVYRVLLFVMIYLPVLFVIFVLIKNKKIDKIIFPIFVSFIVFSLGGIIFSIINYYDVRYLGALIIPTVILAGYYYEVYGYKIVIGFITAVLVVISSCTNISSASLLTPSYMYNTRVYESIRHTMQNILGSYENVIFSFDPELSSILSYNTYFYPEACTVKECSNSSGLFVSKEKEDGLNKYFNEVKDANIYRFKSVKDGEFQLYFYRVNGLKRDIE